jgi:serine/threonine protein kinase
MGKAKANAYAPRAYAPLYRAWTVSKYVSAHIRDKIQKAIQSGNTETVYRNRQKRITYMKTNVQLGRGGYGIVWTGYKRVNRRVARGLIAIKQSKWIEDLKREFAVLKQLQKSPMIVRAHELLHTETKKATMIIDLVDGVPLSSLTTNPKVVYTPQLSRIFLQIALAIDGMHKKGIIHRDLHMGNIMYDPKKKKITLIDFGLAGYEFPARVDHITRAYIEEGPGRMQRMSRKTDIRDLGFIMAQLLFNADSIYDAIQTVVTATYGSVELRKMVTAMLNPDPVLRPNLSEVIQILRKYTNQTIKSTPPPVVQRITLKRRAISDHPLSMRQTKRRNISIRATPAPVAPIRASTDRISSHATIPPIPRTRSLKISSKRTSSRIPLMI